MILILLIGVAGMCMGLIYLATALIAPEFKKAQAVRHSRRCLENMRVLNRGMMLYASRNEGILPPIMGRSALPVRNRAYPQQCPDTRKPYVYNQAMAGVNLRKVTNRAKLILVSEQGFPHEKKASVAFADGTVGTISNREDAVWKP